MPLFLPPFVSPSPVPVDNGLQAWSSDPGLFNNFTLMASGVIYVSQVQIPSPMTVSSIIVASSVTGSTLTAGQNFLGLYDGSGNRLQFVNTDALFASAAGTWIAPITAQALANGIAYVLMVSNGTTPPTLLRQPATTLNSLLTVGLRLRWGRQNLAATVLPSSFASVVDQSTGWFWAGLS